MGFLEPPGPVDTFYRLHRDQVARTLALSFGHRSVDGQNWEWAPVTESFGPEEGGFPLPTVGRDRILVSLYAGDNSRRWYVADVS